MFYRQKILLSLIEAFGGKLSKTDCQKLLFVYCQETKNNFYDFFPHNYGSFSSLIFIDKNRLAQLNYLSDSEDFELRKSNTFLNEIKQKDKASILDFYLRFKNLRGKDLVRYSYLTYPSYASKSKIINEILSSDEIVRISSWWKDQDSACIFSIGYEGLSIDAYLNKLIINQIHVLVDVRNNPRSMKPGFSKASLSRSLKNSGIEYLHIPDLGIPSKLRKNLNTRKDYYELFQHYEKDILSEQTVAINELKQVAKRNKRIALTCFEADYQFCHRHKITELLEKSPDFKIPINHI